MRLDFHRWIVVLFAFVLVASGLGMSWGTPATPAEAGGSWSAWLYSPTAAKLVHIFPNGPTEEMALPVSATVSPPNTVAISPDGNLLAFCVTDDTATATLYIYQLSDMAPLFTHQESNVAYCSVTRYAFMDDSSALAATFFYNPAPDGNGFPTWKIAVIETEYGDELTALYQDGANVTAAAADIAGMSPRVMGFQKVGAPFVIFQLMPWAMEGGCERQGFAWNLSNNTVMPYEIAGHFAADYLPAAGEAIWVATNPSLPVATFVEGPACVGNMVMYGSKATQPYTIYVDTENPIMAVAFINNGQHLAVGRYINSAMQWEALDRNGFTNPLPPSADARQLYGTMDGYIFLREDMNSTQLFYHRIGAHPVPEESVQWQDTSGAIWTVAWVTPMQPAEALPAFPQIPMGD